MWWKCFKCLKKILRFEMNASRDHKRSGTSGGHERFSTSGCYKCPPLGVALSWNSFNPWLCLIQEYELSDLVSSLFGSCFVTKSSNLTIGSWKSEYKYYSLSPIIKQIQKNKEKLSYGETSFVGGTPKTPYFHKYSPLITIFIKFIFCPRFSTKMVPEHGPQLFRHQSKAQSKLWSGLLWVGDFVKTPPIMSML